MEQQKTTIIVLYETGQIAKVQSFVKQKGISLDDCTIIPLEFEIEYELRAQHIPHTSLLQYIPIEEEFADVLEKAQRVPRSFNTHPAMQFFSYQGVNLGEVFEPMLDEYLEYLGRYLRIFKRIAEVVEITTLYIPGPTRQLSYDLTILVPFEILSPIDAATAIGKEKGFDVQIIGEPSQFIPVPKKQQIARRLGIFGLALYNSCIRLFIRPRPLKLYASEYWSHIESFIETMDDVELVFMERKEIENIPWRQLLRHRIRFEHPSDALNAETQRILAEKAESFKQQWQKAKNEVRELFTIVPGIDAWPAIEQALTYLIETQSIRALTDIEGLRRILQEERPDKVLQRASIGGSAHHFFILAQVAHQLGIPSVELQHAGVIFDPRSVHSHLTTSYLAAYGLLEGDRYQKNHGYARERMRAIGSPRFDHYVHERAVLAQDRAKCLAEIGLDPSRPTVFVAVPFPGAYPLLLSSYQVADCVQAFRSAQKEMPELQFIFKFRPGDISSFYPDYIADIFTDGGAVSTKTKDFLPLILASDIACTGRSTLMYEIMLGERPMILFPWLKWDTYTLDVYNRAASVAFNADELMALIRQFLNPREAGKAVQRQNEFLAKNYCFDGHAPERMASLLREKLLPLPL